MLRPIHPITQVGCYILHQLKLLNGLQKVDPRTVYCPSPKWRSARHEWLGRSTLRKWHFSLTEIEMKKAVGATIMPWEHIEEFESSPESLVKDESTPPTDATVAIPVYSSSCRYLVIKTSIHPELSFHQHVLKLVLVSASCHESKFFAISNCLLVIYSLTDNLHFTWVDRMHYPSSR